jgi:hypothetical protein|tara:strand:- start:7211 stop:7960 length:750 start_codon:yes stop_codon:yes gene_type:complete
MSDLDIRFFAPSYRRPYRSPTQELYPCVTLIVSESEREEYEANGNHVETCPDKVQGNVSRVRNFILQTNEEADCVVIMDDDCHGIGRYNHRNGSKERIDGEQLIRFAEQATRLALDGGIKLWGINCLPDPGTYREYRPFSFVAYIGSPFSGHCKTDLFYDERLPLKEDYDLSLQHLYKHKKVLRLNGYHYFVEQAAQGGGCATARNSTSELEQFEGLEKKWGRSIVKRDNYSKRGVDFNPVLKFPLKGV